VTRIQYVYFRVWHIFAIALRFAGIKRQVVLSPKHEKLRLSFLHPHLPFGVGVYVGSIVVEQVALDLRLAGTIQKREFVGPEIGIIKFHIRIVPDVACFGGSHRKQILSQILFMR
jgi:hypothetical protein